ncbi:toll-like receptor 4 [Ostrea edulis]|uniref:toll-like receptor 4 n=1 Tax=Ostrea edulis TaxID=37623 RepID=UPI0024AEA0CB|nr:toll-like receptor 4 [Ostrea edulis]
MEPVKLFAVVFGLYVQEWIVSTLLAHPCITSRDCNCSISAIEGEYYADCSNKNLQNAPNFSNSFYPIAGIDLSINVLSKFPSHLPKTLKYLNVSANSLDRLTRHDIREYPHLIELRMSKCKLKVLESHSLNGSQLRYLDVSGNRELTLSVLKNISCDLSESFIETLILDELQCPIGPSIVLTADHVKCLRNTSLKTLSLASNRIVYLNVHVIPTLPESLTVLNFSDNKLTLELYAFQLRQLKSMKVLDFSYQSRIPELNSEYLACRFGEKDCITGETEQEQREPEPKVYDFDPYNYTFYLPQSLETVYVHNCDLKFKMSHHIYKIGKHLSHVTLQNNVLYEWSTPLYGIEPVRHLDMSNNFCTTVQENFFVDGKNLIFLDLSKNILGDSFAKDIHGNIFRSLRSLNILNISRNKITILPRKMFQTTVNLRELRLSHNQITKFEVMIQHMKYLSLLDISHNQIETLPTDIQEAIDGIAGTHPIKVNLYGNPLSCRCEHFDFIMWLHKHNDIVFLNFENYTCVFQNEKHALNSTTLLKFHKQCAEYSLLTVILFAVILIFTISVICKIIYRFRWRLRYLYYITVKQSNADTADPKPYRYDAFISYAAENEIFAIDVINDLERNSNLRVCFHSRDFIPGTAIADNISNAIQNSRRTVCIVTSHFLQSYWCMFEFNMARMVSFYSRAGENVLSLVLLEKYPTHKMPLDLAEVILSNSYLEYPGNFLDRQSFTSKLAEHL